jgi:hypothetical protein
MLGLYCDRQNKCHIISTIQSVNILTIISSKNPLIEQYIKNLPYEQLQCAFCYKDFCNKEENMINNFIIVLKCKHFFHLQCFINHSKWKYIDRLKKKHIKNTTDDDTTDDDTTDDDTTDEDTTTIDDNCIICKTPTPNFLCVFVTYKKLLQKLKNLQTELDNYVF